MKNNKAVIILIGFFSAIICLFVLSECKAEKEKNVVISKLMVTDKMTESFLGKTVRYLIIYKTPDKNFPYVTEKVNEIKYFDTKIGDTHLVKYSKKYKDCINEVYESRENSGYCPYSDCNYKGTLEKFSEGFIGEFEFIYNQKDNTPNIQEIICTCPKCRRTFIMDVITSPYSDNQFRMFKSKSITGQ